MIKRILNSITYLFLFILCLFMADFYQQPLFLFLLALLIFLPPLSYVICRYAFSHLRCGIAYPVSYGTSGDCITISVKVTSDTIFPLPDCSLRYQITSPFYPCEQERTVIFPAYAKGTFSFDLPLTFHRAGCYEISVLQLSSFDYLHFFTYRRQETCRRELLIYPHKEEVEQFDQTAYGEGFDEFEETQAKGNVSSNVTDIREYIPGDRLQKIHWKLSAKIDKLMVKENEQTSSNQFTILVELYQPSPESDYLERALSNSYTMADSLLRAGEPFFYMFYSLARQDFCRLFIRCAEDLDNALVECFYQSAYTQEDLALTTLQSASMQSGIILHATHKGVLDVIS